MGFLCFFFSRIRINSVISNLTLRQPSGVLGITDETIDSNEREKKLRKLAQWFTWGCKSKKTRFHQFFWDTVQRFVGRQEFLVFSSYNCVWVKARSRDLIKTPSLETYELNYTTEVIMFYYDVKCFGGQVWSWARLQKTISRCYIDQYHSSMSNCFC